MFRYLTLATRLPLIGLLLLGAIAEGATTADADALEDALARAGANRVQLEQALSACEADQRRGMEFLIENMPAKDLQTLTSAFLLGHVRHAYRTWRSVPWRDSVPEEVFLNGVLPYASVNERRDEWREDFHQRFRDHLAGVTTPGDAAVVLNQKVFQQVGVKYSTKRPKADQSPYESIDAGLASCTGLSILLIDACRSVGVPARFVGTPRWSDNSGNHSWVEIWDNGWHFTGAAEPTGNELDKAWFTGRAGLAQRDHQLHAIYAVSYRKTPLNFPLVWNSDYDDLTGVNVTDRYTKLGHALPPGKVRVRFRVIDEDQSRHATGVSVLGTGVAAGELAFVGTTKDERFDANDHVTSLLTIGQRYEARAENENGAVSAPFTASEDQLLITLSLPAAKEPSASPTTATLEQLHTYLARPRDSRPAIASQPFAKTALTAEESAIAARLLWADLAEHVRATRAEEMQDRLLAHDGHEMPFHYSTYGEAPESGRSLYISMHGGGGAPKRVNDQQWENQKKLYRPEEGIYVAPRAPTNTWNLWHQGHIDPLFDRLITNMIAFEKVDPNRVYIMGYSAGGDGVYQLAPRMADRLAAAAMMAGHPNETSPLGLRNLPFALHMGGKDSAYKRNQIARDWKKKLAELRSADPEGYPHQVEIHESKGHWMDREDAKAVPWMAEHRRNPTPKKIVWVQDDVTHSRFYWLSVDEPAARAHVTASVVSEESPQTIEIETNDISALTVRFNDALIDFSKPVRIVAGGHTLYEGTVERTIAVLAKTLEEREDPHAVFPAEVSVVLPTAKSPK